MSDVNRKNDLSKSDPDESDADRELRRQGAKHSVEGKADKLKGRVKEAMGGLTGDRSKQVEGKIDQLKGKAKDTLGKLERDVSRKDVDDTP